MNTKTEYLYVSLLLFARAMTLSTALMTESAWGTNSLVVYSFIFSRYTGRGMRISASLLRSKLSKKCSRYQRSWKVESMLPSAFFGGSVILTAVFDLKIAAVSVLGCLAMI